jgi:hypothetical protein
MVWAKHAWTSSQPPVQIRSVLAQKQNEHRPQTHDATRWMSHFDTSGEGVSGPYRVKQLAKYFEDGGAPFHAWCVVQGREPERQAWMCADVLAAGARSMIIDLEPYPGFWEASSVEANIFGSELRRLQPNAWVSVSVDSSPLADGGFAALWIL